MQDDDTWDAHGFTYMLRACAVGCSFIAVWALAASIIVPDKKYHWPPRPVLTVLVVVSLVLVAVVFYSVHKAYQRHRALTAQDAHDSAPRR